jgi:hypothetical protein
MIENSAHVQDESTHGPHQNNEFLDSFQRSCRKHLSFSKNGGLSGCVQQATAERRQRQGSYSSTQAVHKSLSFSVFLFV